MKERNVSLKVPNPHSLFTIHCSFLLPSYLSIGCSWLPTLFPNREKVDLGTKSGHSLHIMGQWHRPGYRQADKWRFSRYLDPSVPLPVQSGGYLVLQLFLPNASIFWSGSSHFISSLSRNLHILIKDTKQVSDRKPNWYWYLILRLLTLVCPPPKLSHFTQKNKNAGLCFRTKYE